LRDGVVDLPVSPAYAAPLALKAGEGATVIVTDVVEKGKPPASPAN
jgi:hypothetical protein